MDAIDCIKTRRSIRKYKNKEVPQEIIDDILECGLRAPSSCDTQPWAFIVVKDIETRKALSKVSRYSSFIADAPVCIVACLTPGELRYNPNKYLSVACAVENMLLAIHSYELGSCWTYIKDLDDPIVEEKAKKILKIPKNTEVICMLPIGYPDQKITKRELRKKKGIVHIEKW